MLRDVTIGQFYPVDSIIHRLDARVKLFGLLIFIISLFVFGNIASYCLAGFFLALCIILSRVPFKYMVRGLKPIILLLIFTSVMNIFFTKGTVIAEFWKITITKEGIYLALNISLRLIFFILASLIITLTTTATMLTDALEKILSPLKKIKVPVHEISMMMTIALRFIPVLAEEADKIMKAQSARGMNFSSGNIIKRMKNIVPLIVPLFVSAVRRSNELAQAMESRCYRGGEGRTKMKPMKYSKMDYLAYIILLMYFVVSWVIYIVLQW